MHTHHPPPYPLQSNACLKKTKLKRSYDLLDPLRYWFFITQLPWGSSYKIDWNDLNNGIQPESSDVYFIMS